MILKLSDPALFRHAPSGSALLRFRGRADRAGRGTGTIAKARDVRVVGVLWQLTNRLAGFGAAVQPGARVSREPHANSIAPLLSADRQAVEHLAMELPLWHESIH